MGISMAASFTERMRRGRMDINIQTSICHSVRDCGLNALKAYVVLYRVIVQFRPVGVSRPFGDSLLLLLYLKIADSIKFQSVPTILQGVANYYSTNISEVPLKQEENETVRLHIGIRYKIGYESLMAYQNLPSSGQ